MPLKHEDLINSSRDLITLIDRSYRYEVANDAYCTAMDRSRGQIVGRTVAEVWGQGRFETAIKAHLDACLDGRVVEYVERFQFGPFDRHMHVTYSPYRGEDGAVTHVVVCSHDITHISQIESKLSQYEFKDPTTGLFNRKSLDIILDKEIAHAKQSDDRRRGVLFISIENLGNVNEVFGAATGDLLLENTGLRVQKCLSPGDFLFRFVGNELTAVLVRLDRPSDAGRIAQEIVEQVKIPYTYQGADIRIGCCIGISLYPDDGEDARSVIGHASAAMRSARRAHREFQFFNPDIHSRASERLSLETDMQRAFDQEQFRLAYQPIVDASGRIMGAEALIRWKHPAKGNVPPGEFLPLAAESGFIHSISKWVLFAAAEQVARWSSRHGVFVSVNLSAEDFANAQLADVIASALRRYGGTAPGFLKLEITESQCMIDPEATVAQMDRLSAAGFDLFIDDFGTGNSSLGWLKRLPAGTIKIDRSFVDESMRSPEDMEFLSTIVALARSRRKRVILEGIGTPQQHDALRGLTVDGLQGYYFASPVSAPELDALLAAKARLPLPASGSASTPASPPAGEEPAAG